MGLSGGKKRVKINHDPNNTQWSRSTTNFGHRMLVSQGWEPGEVLGASSSSAYATNHLTEGSKSHIKAAFREDNLGLGAKRGSGQDAGECVGLDAFQGLLGRLNGKSDEVLEKEQRSRDDLKRARYVEQRGQVQFISGGTLTSDMDELVELARQSRISFETKLGAAVEEEKDTGKAKKEKRRSKKEKKAESCGAAEAQHLDEIMEDSTGSKERRSKKRKNKEANAQSGSGSTSDAPPNDSNSEDEKSRKARRKTEKAEKRIRKMRKREERAAQKDFISTAVLEAEEPQTEQIVKETIVVAPTQPSANAAKQNNSLGGRHTSVRSRYIAAKRRAVMDPQALKEILMVKA